MVLHPQRHPAPRPQSYRVREMEVGRAVGESYYHTPILIRPESDFSIRAAVDLLNAHKWKSATQHSKLDEQTIAKTLSLLRLRR
jgi:hypothetical protein